MPKKKKKKLAQTTEGQFDDQTRQQIQDIADADHVPVRWTIGTLCREAIAVRNARVPRLPVGR